MSALGSLSCSITSATSSVQRRTVAIEAAGRHAGPPSRGARGNFDKVTEELICL
jgi:hypothetical protein